MTSDASVVLNECAGILQYCQEIFEGLKAYTAKDGSIVTFRPDLNAERMRNSAVGMEMPPFPKERFLEAVDQVAAANAAWVPPYGTGASLYLRLYMFATGPVIGVKPSDEYQFRLFCTPVGPYFKGGARPLTLCVSDYDRAAPRGTGHLKAGLNYAMSLHAYAAAHKAGSDTILPSITKKSMLYVAEHFLGMKVTERPERLAELADFAECGLCGTAAVISPVGKVVDHGTEICFPGGMNRMGPVIQKLYDTLTGIQLGTAETPEGWIRKIL